MGDSNTPWFWAYNGFAAIEYQVIDWSSQAHGDVFAIGGRTSACSDVTGSSDECVTGQNAAVIMLYDSKTDAEPTYMHVKSEVTVGSDTVSVVGVLAIRAITGPTADKVNALGVFETVSSISNGVEFRSLIFFRSSVHTGGDLEVFADPTWHHTQGLGLFE